MNLENVIILIIIKIDLFYGAGYQVVMDLVLYPLQFSSGALDDLSSGFHGFSQSFQAFQQHPSITFMCCLLYL
jgi:hypothetical protein